MSQRICKGPEWEDVAHYVMGEFIQRADAQALIDRGEAMKYMSGMIHLSYYSHTSPYHKLYRQSGMVHELYDSTRDGEPEAEDYNIEADLLTEEILGILTDMESENIELWYMSTLFQMWLQEPNYSQISRKTGIPRTSISQAVDECRTYVRETLKQRNIDLDY